MLPANRLSNEAKGSVQPSTGRFFFCRPLDQNAVADLVVCPTRRGGDNSANVGCADCFGSATRILAVIVTANRRENKAIDRG
jgi:hypothetical protein